MRSPGWPLGPPLSRLPLPGGPSTRPLAGLAILEAGPRCPAHWADTVGTAAPAWPLTPNGPARSWTCPGGRSAGVFARAYETRDAPGCTDERRAADDRRAGGCAAASTLARSARLGALFGFSSP